MVPRERDVTSGTEPTALLKGRLADRPLARRRVCCSVRWIQMAAIDCTVLRSSDTPAVVPLLGKAFSATEPPAVAMGLTRTDVEQFVQLLCPKAAADGLTIVARARGTGTVVGVLLTHDFAVLPDLDTRRFSHKFVEATGVVSQHVVRKLGFADRYRVRYQDYRYDGREVFASIREHEAVILMDRPIG